MRLYHLMLLLFLMAAPLLAQPVAYPHPELEWKSTELDHCAIHVHNGLEELGLVAAQIMEEIWDPITELYDYVPDTKIHLIFYDTDDYSNGGAYFYNNKIIIWATSLDFDLRGQHNWLRNVLTHEFTHIIQLGASRKFSRQVPFAYLQVMGYEPEKRDDVVQGFPNRVISYPVPGTTVPAWFAEGTAQHMVDGNRYDFWDSQRDMVLRDRVMHGDLFDFDEMASFDKSTVGGESVYNQGFSFVNWLTDKHGEDVMRRISEELARPLRVSMSNAMEAAIGVDGHTLWEQWKRDLEKRYGRQLAAVDADRVEGRIISLQDMVSQVGHGGDDALEELSAPRGMHGQCCGFQSVGISGPPDELGPTNNIYSRVTADGKFVYYASNGDADWLGMTDLWRYDRQAGSNEKVLPNIRGAFSLSPDGASVIFSRTSPADKAGYHYKDLYQYFIEQKLTRRLTKMARLSQPDVSPDGRSIVCVRNGGGSRWLELVELDSLDGPAWEALSKQERKQAPKLGSRTLRKDDYGTQYFQPRWHPDGTSVVAARAWGHGRDIVEVDAGTGELRELVATANDERYPQWNEDGSWLYYTQDRDGIFNVFRSEAATGRIERLTQVAGGAFMPFVRADTLYYSGYRNRGFRLMELPVTRSLGDTGPGARPDYLDAIPPLSTTDLDPRPRDWQPLKSEFEKPFVIPRLVLDDGEFKPGFYLLNMDVFERVQFSASVAASRMNNMDLFAAISAQWRRSILFTELYGMIRDHDSRFEDTFRIVGEDGGDPVYDTYAVAYKFSLSEGHFGIRHRFNDAMTGEAAVSLAKYKARYRQRPVTVNYDYYKAAGLSMKLDFAVRGGNRVDDFINPRGRRWTSLVVKQHWDQLIDGFEVSSAGLLEEKFIRSNFLEAELSGGRSWTLPLFPELALTLDGRVAALSDEDLDDFYYLYAGGLLGLKGYSYYALGGPRMALGHLRLGFPIIKRTGVQVGPWHFKRLYASLFTGAGDAWGGEAGGFDLKREAGADLKLFLTSWSFLPTAVTLGGAYGLDEFRVDQLDPGETYGREWRWYATLLFDFDTF